MGGERGRSKHLRRVEKLVNEKVKRSWDDPRPPSPCGWHERFCWWRKDVEQFLSWMHCVFAEFVPEFCRSMGKWCFARTPHFLVLFSLASSSSPHFPNNLLLLIFLFFFFFFLASLENQLEKKTTKRENEYYSWQ